MSYIYWFYFIKQNHLYHLLNDILKSKNIWILLKTSAIYIGCLIVCPLIYQFVVMYYLYQFNHFDSMLINMVKLGIMSDVLILLIGSIGTIFMYLITIPFIQFSSEDSSD